MTAARKFAATMPDRGYRPVHSSGCRCPGCGLSCWHIGRTSAECARCGTALPLSPEPRLVATATGGLSRAQSRGKIFSFRRVTPPEAPAAFPLAAGVVDPENP